MDTTPDSHYLLDTNSLFYLIQTELDSTKAAFKTNADILKAGSLYISAVTRVEVFSALGKTIRGKPEVRQPCGRMTITGGVTNVLIITPGYAPHQPRSANHPQDCDTTRLRRIRKAAV